MDENNVHTSVLIELANQEEAENQNTFRINIDDVDSPKDYVIDQIFCGENVTVYALFEVPEGYKVSDRSLIDIPNSNFQDNYKFFHKSSYSSYKKVINEKKLNVFKNNSPVIRSDEDVKLLLDKNRGSGSLYCLKHVGGDYKVLMPEKKNSELKILYNKEFKESIGIKFKSKGVNTDIVQSPRIIEEVQRSVGVNISFEKSKEKNVEDSCTSFSQSSYEVIDMNVQQSYSSVNSDSDKKSVPNFFIVPLLMKEDRKLSHCVKTDKSQRLEEKKLSNYKETITSRISLGTNTDISFDLCKKTDQESNEISQSESYKTDSENYEDQNQKKENWDKKLKINSKEKIIKEIKIMKKKLNILIRSIESNDFVYNRKENESSSKTIIDRTENLERMSEPLLNEIRQKKYQKLDKRPIFLPFRYPSYLNKVRIKSKKGTESINEQKKSKTSTASKKSLSNDFLPRHASPNSTAVNNVQTPKDNVKKLPSNAEINCVDLENRKILRMSKSESCVRIIIPIPKHNSNNVLKKSQSFDLKCDKIEALKKTKNFFYKVESCIKTKTNIRTHQNKEGSLRDNLSLMKCEMGDDVDKKSINPNNEVLNVIQVAEKTEKLEKSGNSGLEEIVADIKKNFYEQEGDAKLVYPKETLVTANVEEVQVHYHYANVIFSESLLKQKKITSPRLAISKIVDKSAEIRTKVSGDVEKPPTPNKSGRKISIPDATAKRDVKINKKVNNGKVKIMEKSNKSEAKDLLQVDMEKKKTLIGSRKSARHNGDSKLHIDKLIKFDNLGINHKASFSTKSSHDEKTGTKYERMPRPISQKQERSEQSIDILSDESNKEKSETLKKKSNTLMEIESFHKNDVKETEEPLCPENKEEIPREVNSNLPSENIVPLSTNPSSVVVELYSEKPKSVKDFYCKIGQENLEKAFNPENETFEKNGVEKKISKKSENFEKPVVKSVWALTKVLLFEDGTNKLEILEASLTPPDYTLN